MRKRLPDTRDSITRRFKLTYTREDGTIDKLKLYVTASRYEDGTLGEIFIRADKVGSFISGALDMTAVMMSIGLQHGVPLEDILSKMRHSRFEPAGRTGDPSFPSCSSAFDLIAQWLGATFGAKIDAPKPPET